MKKSIVKALFSKTTISTVGVANTSGTFKFDTQYITDVLHSHLFEKRTFKQVSEHIGIEDRKRIHNIIGGIYQELIAFKSSVILLGDDELNTHTKLTGGTDDIDDLDRTDGFRLWFRLDKEQVWHTYIQLSTKSVTEVYQIIKQIDSITEENPVRELFFDAIVDYFVPTF